MTWSPHSGSTAGWRNAELSWRESWASSCRGRRCTRARRTRSSLSGWRRSRRWPIRSSRASPRTRVSAIGQTRSRRDCCSPTCSAGTAESRSPIGGATSASLSCPRTSRSRRASRWPVWSSSVRRTRATAPTGTASRRRSSTSASSPPTRRPARACRSWTWPRTATNSCCASLGAGTSSIRGRWCPTRSCPPRARSNGCWTSAGPWWPTGSLVTATIVRPGTCCCATRRG